MRFFTRRRGTRHEASTQPPAPVLLPADIDESERWIWEETALPEQRRRALIEFDRAVRKAAEVIERRRPVPGRVATGLPQEAGRLTTPGC